MTVILWLSFVLLATPARADIFIEHLDPPTLQADKPTRLTVHGSDLKNAIGLWTTMPGNENYFSAKLVSKSDVSAVFDVIVKTDPARGLHGVGLHGLRLVSRDGLSNVQLFLVDDLNTVKRDAGDEPQLLKWPVAVHGTFREATVDQFTVEITAGQTLSIEVVGNRFGKDADPLLTIRDADGRFVAERDNDVGLYFDFRFSHRFEKAGRYTLHLRDSRYRGSPHQPYVLRVGAFPAGRVGLSVGTSEVFLPETGKNFPIGKTEPHAGPRTIVVKTDGGSAWLPRTPPEHPAFIHPGYNHPLGAGQRAAASPEMVFAFQMSKMKANPFASLDRLIVTGPAQASKVTVPCVVGGVLRQPGERQAVWFELAKGQNVWMKAEAKNLNSPVDVDFMMVDKNGREVRRPDGNREPPSLEFTANNPGIYGVIVRDILNGGGSANAYQLTISDEPFPLLIQAEAEGITIPQGTWQPLPLTITRIGGGSGGELKLKLHNAPPGMTLTPEVIPAGKNAIVCRLGASSSTPVGMNTLRLTAEETLPDKKTRDIIVRTQPLIDRQLHNVDLIPIGLREDQRRLPPGVTDRLAVQVTPPSPFDFDPAEEVTLPRYQTCNVPLTIRRTGNASGELTFTAKGGQLGPKTEGRTRVYAEFPTAKPGETAISGQIRSLILTNLAKSRIDVTVTGHDGDRRICLTRPFELNVTTAFTVNPEPAMPKTPPLIQPGETATLTLKCERLKSFTGPVTVRFNTNGNFEMPETVSFAAGQTTATVPVKARLDTGNGRHRLDFHATAQVDGYEEEYRNSAGEVEVKKAEPPKKK
ncbi:hypothetical protein [Zavarzinella formosa]|uniref:hypothetical protein n=1 Tax=Zavarzinella formosa TaxID=360055 RepID=UPI0002E66B70|nr:hypothetical protein [Zavarzinella formosa]